MARKGSKKRRRAREKRKAKQNGQQQNHGHSRGTEGSGRSSSTLQRVGRLGNQMDDIHDETTSQTSPSRTE
jgi:hypothetical protein